MKTAMLLIFLAVATVSGDDSRSMGYMNGRAWRRWADVEKAGYLLGMGDGLTLGLKTTLPTKVDEQVQHAKDYFGQSTFSEIKDAMDDFYRDPANVQIPVETAMAYFQDKVNGKSPEKLAEELANLRGLAAALQ